MLGNNAQFLAVDIPGVAVTLRNDALHFIINHCCIKWTANENKAIVIQVVSASSRTSDDPCFFYQGWLARTQELLPRMKSQIALVV
jgi:hypothetical protein